MITVGKKFSVNINQRVEIAVPDNFLELHPIAAKITDQEWEEAIKDLVCDYVKHKLLDLDPEILLDLIVNPIMDSVVEPSDSFVDEPQYEDDPELKYTVVACERYIRKAELAEYKTNHPEEFDDGLPF